MDGPSWNRVLVAEKDFLLGHCYVRDNLAQRDIDISEDYFAICEALLARHFYKDQEGTKI